MTSFGMFPAPRERLATRPGMKNMISRIILLAIVVAAGSAQTLVSSNTTAVEPPTAQKLALGASASSRTFEVIVDPSELADAIAASGGWRLDASPIPIHLRLVETPLFAPGENKVVTRDTTGAIVDERPYGGRLFEGSVVGNDRSWASLLVGEMGVHAVVDNGDAVWSLQPSAPGSPRHSLVAEPGGAEGGADIEQNCPPPYFNLYVKPYAEPNYVSYASNWQDRIASAYAAGRNMFRSEVCIDTWLYSIENTGINFGQPNNCDGEGSGVLWNFKYWVEPRMFTGPNAYALFSASDMGSGVGGCGHVDRLNSWSGGPFSRDATSAIAGRDWHWFDSYDPDESNHLGQSANHELAHQAGEELHPNDRYNWCNYNLMANGQPFQCTNFWFASASETRIKEYAYTRISTV